jgi:hypothetical protein
MINIEPKCYSPLRRSFQLILHRSSAGVKTAFSKWENRKSKRGLAVSGAVMVWCMRSCFIVSSMFVLLVEDVRAKAAP